MALPPGIKKARILVKRIAEGRAQPGDVEFVERFTTQTSQETAKGLQRFKEQLVTQARIRQAGGRRTGGAVQPETGLRVARPKPVEPTQQQRDRATALTEEAQRKEFGRVLVSQKELTETQLKKAASLTEEAQVKEFGTVIIPQKVVEEAEQQITFVGPAVTTISREVSRRGSIALARVRAENLAAQVRQRGGSFQGETKVFFIPGETLADEPTISFRVSTKDEDLPSGAIIVDTIPQREPTAEERARFMIETGEVTPFPFEPGDITELGKEFLTLGKSILTGAIQEFRSPTIIEELPSGKVQIIVRPPTPPTEEQKQFRILAGIALGGASLSRFAPGVAAKVFKAVEVGLGLRALITGLRPRETAEFLLISGPRVIGGFKSRTEAQKVLERIEKTGPIDIRGGTIVKTEDFPQLRRGAVETTITKPSIIVKEEGKIPSEFFDIQRDVPVITVATGKKGNIELASFSTPEGLQRSTIFVKDTKGIVTHLVKTETQPSGETIVKVFRGDKLIQQFKTQTSPDLAFGETTTELKLLPSGFSLPGKISELRIKREEGKVISLVGGIDGLVPTGGRATTIIERLQAEEIVPQFVRRISRKIGEETKELISKPFQFVRGPTEGRIRTEQVSDEFFRVAQPVVSETAQLTEIESRFIVNFVQPGPKIKGRKPKTGEQPLTEFQQELGRRIDTKNSKDIIDGILEAERRDLISLSQSEKRLLITKSPDEIVGNTASRETFNKIVNKLSKKDPQLIVTEEQIPIARPPSITRIERLEITTPRAIARAIRPAGQRFLGTFQIPLSVLSIRTEQGIVTVAKPITKPIQIQEPIVTSIQIQQQITTPALIQVPITEPITVPITKPIVIPIVTPIVTQVPKVPKIPTVPRVPPPPRISPPPQKAKREKITERIQKETGFIALLKKRVKISKGKFKDVGFKAINKKALTKKEAKGLLFKTLDTFAEQTGKIRKVAKQVTPTKPNLRALSESLAFKFRPSKDKKLPNTFIERRKFAIDSKMELRQVTFEGQKAIKRNAFLRKAGLLKAKRKRRKRK